jgi:hypothetical protein
MIPFSINMTYEEIPNKPRQMQTLYDRTIAYAADKLMIESKALCPVKTGRLQNSIQQKIIPDGRSVGPDTPYDIYVEYGHRTRGGGFVKANPPPYGYMRGGIRKAKRYIADFMSRNFEMLMKATKVTKV